MSALGWMPNILVWGCYKGLMNFGSLMWFLLGLVLGVLGWDIFNCASICLGVAAHICTCHSVYYTFVRPWCMQVLAYKGEADRLTVTGSKLWGFVNKKLLLQFRRLTQGDGCYPKKTYMLGEAKVGGMCLRWPDCGLRLGVYAAGTGGLWYMHSI